MAEFCSKCGAPLNEGSRFCGKCGYSADQEVSKTPEQSAAELPSDNKQDTQSEKKTSDKQAKNKSGDKKNKAQDKAKKHKNKKTEQLEKSSAADAPASSQEKTAPAQEAPPPEKNAGKKKEKKPLINAGAVLCAAIMCISCLPYVLKSLIFGAVKASLGNFLCVLIELICIAAAAGILFVGSKIITGKRNLPSAVLLASVLPAIDAADALLISRISALTPKLNFVYGAGIVFVRFAAAALAVSALKRLFIPERGEKQRGGLIAFLCALAGVFSADIIAALWGISPFEDVHSFFATFAIKALSAFMAVCFFTLASDILLKKRGPASGKEKKDSPVALVIGGALAAFFTVTSLIAGAPASVTKTAVDDVTESIVEADLLLAIGDMDGAVESYELAAEHCAAWAEAASGGDYVVPEQYTGDKTLEYLSYVNGEADRLRDMLVVDLDEENIDMWCPLMISLYKEKAKLEKLSKNEKAHMDELVRLCIADECFVFNYPLKKDIRKENDDLEKAMKFPEESTPQIEMAEVIAKVQRAEINSSDGVSMMLDVAEKYPDNIIFQYMAGSAGAANRWDGAGHYGRSAEALERYRQLWLDEFGADASQEELTELDSSIAGMMLEMGSFNEAAPILEEALKADSSNLTLMQQLALCYSSSGETEKGYELSKKLYEAAPDDVSVLWSYCVGALKHSEKEEAVKAAAKMADIVCSGLDAESGADEAMFNAVLYLSLDDNSQWTDFQYRAFDGKDTEPALLNLFKENEFLYNYVQAVYYEKQCLEPEKALPYAQKALSMQEDSNRLTYLNGMIYYDSGDFDKALELYKKADSLCPDDPSILFALANTYDALEDYQTAFDYCERALAHFPNGVDHSNDRYGVSYHARDLYNRLLPYVEVSD